MCDSHEAARVRPEGSVGAEPQVCSSNSVLNDESLLSTFCPKGTLSHDKLFPEDTNHEGAMI